MKQFFWIFHGTVVFEDGENVAKISQILYETGNAESVGEIGNYWWNRFKALFENAYGENFRTQRDLEIQSLKDTIGDSLSSDVKGAGALGINTMWINRSGKDVPEGVVSIVSLMDILDKVDL